MHELILAFMAAHADQINGTIEICGSLFVFNNCRILFNDKMVKGASALTVGFFFLWGFWNTVWYPFLHQPWSFFGGAMMALANLTNVLMMVYYKYLHYEGD